MILELFAGSGGASLGIHRALPDEYVLGVEYDRDACATRAAAGLATLRADVSQLPTAPFVGKVSGTWSSSPCPQFSMAGKGAGVKMLAALTEGITRILRGDDCRAEIREHIAPEMATIVRAEWDKKAKDYTPAQVQREATRRTNEACLVLEPARFAHDLRPDWVACEQVPAVLPLWVAMGHGLERLGYGWWAGILDVADWGVPQNRPRAVLMARADAEVRPPSPTHSDPRYGGSLFGLEPWRSMESALGWGMTDRPYPAVCWGHRDPAGLGGAGGRQIVERERERERERNWVERENTR